MAPIPQHPPQPTVEAIYAAYERNADTEHRPHLGASLIGRECSRELFYTHRWCTNSHHSGRLLRLFQRGQMEEAQFVADLRAAGVTVHEVDPATGNQFRFSDIGGHFGGSMDACAFGLLEAPKTWSVVEMKTHNAKSFAKLKAEGVEKSKPEHAAQMQCYMHWSGLTRAFYLAVCKDNDELYSERIKYNKDLAESLLSKAHRIITAQEPPPRISDNPSWFACQWCSHKAICHEDAIPLVNCRTCAHATPVVDDSQNGAWICEKFNCPISTETQRQGAQCPAHVFSPALMPWKAVDADENAGWIEYENGLKNGPGFLASGEVKA
jgi:hypothetical protein